VRLILRVLCLLFHVVGWTCMLVATVGVMFVFVQITVCGYFYGYEPVLMVCLSELALYIFGSCYAVYVFVGFLRHVSGAFC
jgi:hypothetical protein